VQSEAGDGSNYQARTISSRKASAADVAHELANSVTHELANSVIDFSSSRMCLLFRKAAALLSVDLASARLLQHM
jgi:hypothetical protein